MQLPPFPNRHATLIYNYYYNYYYIEGTGHYCLTVVTDGFTGSVFCCRNELDHTVYNTWSNHREKKVKPKTKIINNN